MKIAIITIHSQHNNFGSILQAYALKQYLTLEDHEVQIIDYRPSYANGGVGIKKKVIIAIVSLFFFPYYIKRKKRFDAFINKYDNVTTKCYKSFKELCNQPPLADVYISGSDQIWNPYYECGRDPAFYLKFTDSLNKISYGSSIGREDLSEDEYSFLLDNTKEYKYISVREKLSQIQISERIRKDVKHVCDPVFLLTSEHYRKLYKKAVIKNKYILVYAVNKDPLLEAIVNKVASILNIRIIAIGGFAKKCKYDEYLRDAGPIEFLELIDNSEFVVTSSFHGTAFSLIFNKQFILVPPRLNLMRISSILEISGAIDRMITSCEDVERLISAPTDYAIINCKLESFISSSKIYLRNSINGVTGGL